MYAKRYNSKGEAVDYTSIEESRANYAKEKEDQAQVDALNSDDPMVSIQALVKKVEKLEKQQIKIVGDFDGTNIPVTVNGIRKKIATTSP